MRRVDRRTNALPDRQTDQQTDRPTGTASYRGALSHLKIEEEGEKGNVSKERKTRNSKKGKVRGLEEREKRY